MRTTWLPIRSRRYVCHRPPHFVWVLSIGTETLYSLYHIDILCYSLLWSLSTSRTITDDASHLQPSESRMMCWIIFKPNDRSTFNNNNKKTYIDEAIVTGLRLIITHVRNRNIMKCVCLPAIVSLNMSAQFYIIYLMRETVAAASIHFLLFVYLCVSDLLVPLVNGN